MYLKNNLEDSEILWQNYNSQEEREQLEISTGIFSVLFYVVFFGAMFVINYMKSLAADNGKSTYTTVGIVVNVVVFFILGIFITYLSKKNFRIIELVIQMIIPLIIFVLSVLCYMGIIDEYMPSFIINQLDIIMAADSILLGSIIYRLIVKATSAIQF